MEHLTVSEYQRFDSIALSDLPEEDILIGLVSIIDRKTVEQVEAMPLKRFKRRVRAAEQTLARTNPPEPKASLKVKGKRFIPQYDISKMKFGNYVEAVHFLKSNGEFPISRLHLIGASMFRPFDYFKPGDNPSDPTKWAVEHEWRAKALLSVPFLPLYTMALAFCQQLASFHEGWAELLDLPRTREELEEVHTNPFSETYGWMENAQLIADEQKITVPEVWNMNAGNAFYVLSYIKARNVQKQLNGK